VNSVSAVNLSAVCSTVKTLNGTLITGQQDVVKQWTEYGRQLYTDTGVHEGAMIRKLKARHDSEERGDDSIILRAEVEKAVKKHKDKNSPGVDDILAELIKAGGPVLITQIHRHCNIIRKKETWPDE